MKILVTGGAGYIGCHVVGHLLERGIEPVVLDDLSKGHRRHLAGGVFIEGNYGDPTLLNQLFGKHKIDAVIHLAADSLVGESVSCPDKYFKNNTANGLTLLDILCRHGVKKFVFSSTAAVYGEPDQVPIEESHPCRPANPYGWSKLVFEHALEAFHRAGHLQYVSLRYFNAAGADPNGRFGELHDPETHLIPNLLNAVLGKRPQLEMYGTDYATNDGTAVRDYIHVRDLAEAHILAVDALQKGRGGIYNLGSECGFSVREVVQKAEKVIEQKVPYVERPRRAGDPAVLIASSQKIKRELGWKPEHSDLETIVRSAWQWAQKTESV